jgi:hypothetical protein
MTGMRNLWHYLSLSPLVWENSNSLGDQIIIKELNLEDGSLRWSWHYDSMRMGNRITYADEWYQDIGPWKPITLWREIENARS